jgi:3-deoxy-D-manno-octulosonic-acid transferase
MFVVYEVLLYLVFILTAPFFLLTGFLRGKYLSNFPERMGFYRSRPEGHDLWIHAVSVGETLAARPVVDEILRQRPGTSIVFTTTTLTGQTQARRLYPHATVTYFPFDFTFAVKRFLDHHRPRVFATMETEIWPNVTRLSRARGVRMVLANGRISDRSFPRYRAFRAFVAPVLARYDRILAREETDRQRFAAIGAPAAVVETSGNVKFDYQPDDAPLEDLDAISSLIDGRPVIVLGSTLAGEDELLLPELERFIRETHAFAIIAPRKPERFDIVDALLSTTSLRAVRRSAIPSVVEGPGGVAASESRFPPIPGPSTTLGMTGADVLLLDTFGELAKIYRFAQVAFVGGSLVPLGGHNPIEPAAAGVPVCFGRSMSNFREIAQVFLDHEAAQEVGSAEEVFAFARRMLADPALRAAWGGRGREAVAQNRGASERTARRIVELLS